MSRYNKVPVPEGYTIVPVHGRHYPMALELNRDGVPTARGYYDNVKRAPVSYSKRFYAANFILQVTSGSLELGDLITLVPAQPVLNQDESVL